MNGCMYIPGDKMSAIEDDWVTVGPGHEKNVGKAFSGVVKDVDYVDNQDPRKHGRWIVTFTDGRAFARHDCYDARSPWGWKQVS